jgi:predicted short-subunit dehydrogenase-like oxidoreductase (DUF2520 family)
MMEAMAIRFSILGRGRVGRALAAAWGSKVALLPHDTDPAGLVLLAVPDDAIAAMALKFPGRCVHLSGSFHLDDVPCAHPLMSFDGTVQDWQNTPLAITGEVPIEIRGAFLELGFLPFELSATLKPLYHAAAVLSAGHAATLWLGAQTLLREKGIELPGRGLWPLAQMNLTTIERFGAKGKTGPFVRGDEATIDRDAQALPLAWRELFLKLGKL